MSLAGADREAQSIKIRKMQNYNINNYKSNIETERGFAKKEYASNEDNYALQSMRSDILQDSLQLSAAPSQTHVDKKLDEIKVTQSVSSI